MTVGYISLNYLYCVLSYGINFTAQYVKLKICYFVNVAIKHR